MLIIQPSLPAYRKDLFCHLASKYSGDITILHFGHKSDIKHENITELVGDIYSIKGFRVVRDLKSIIRKHSVVVVGFDPHWVNLFLLPVLARDKRIVLWGHGLGKNKYVNRLRILILKKASSFIAYSEDKRQEMINAGANAEKVIVANNTLHVSNAVDTSLLSKKNFLFIGRLQRRKKLDVFFHIFFELKLGLLGYTITIVGDGEEEKERLSNLAKKLGVLEFVYFVKGTTSDAELLSYFSDAAFYVSPGAVGLGVLHSFSYGVPVLTMQDENHGPEVINIQDGINGYIFNDRDEFAMQLLAMLGSSHAVEMGRQAFVFYKNERSMSQMVDSFLFAAESK